MALSEALGRAWRLARKAEELLELQRTVRQSLSKIEERVDELKDRMTSLDAGQKQMLTEARNAAIVAASGVIADAVTRITRLEARTDQLEQRRLSSG